ncbi:MAG: hypothetical protein MI861_03770, partial [Pirellulales bacterium]|nr:hypothetical protein [Pirellulales bacterium]
MKLSSVAMRREAIMRHVTDQSITRVVESDFDPGVQADFAAPPYSLRSILRTARFFAGDDIEFDSIADSAAEACEGSLVVYRIGDDCPSRLVADAVARGAAGILTEQVLPCHLPQCVVGDLDLARAEIAAHQLDRPDRKLLTIGVIGSAGKTCTSLLIASLFRQTGIRTAYQTDLGESDGLVQTTPDHTVPSGASLIHWLGDANDSDCKVAVVELSDHQARHGRYDALEFDLLVVSGSADGQRDFGESGLQCVLQRLRPQGVVIAPADDPKSIRTIRDSGVRMVSYGIRKPADVTAKIIEQSGGMTTLLVNHDDTTVVMETPLCGAAMAANHAA